MSKNDIIIRTHYESPLRMHIDSDIPVSYTHLTLPTKLEV